MMSEGSSSPGDGQSASADRPQTLAFQGLVNRVVRGLLRTPLVSRGIGSKLVTLYVVGRKSGKRYTVPVAYTPHEGALLIGTPFGWGRNLRTGEPVDILLKGKRRQADVEAITDEAGVVEHYAIICRDNRNFATLNKVGIDPDGTPNSADLHRVWAAGARVFLLTPR